MVIDFQSLIADFIVLILMNHLMTLLHIIR